MERGRGAEDDMGGGGPAEPASGVGASVDALLALVCLEDMPRTGWIQRGIGRPESVAGHVLGAAHLALALAPREGLDPARVAALLLVHDAPEALLGDLPRTGSRLLPPGAKRAAEDAAADRLLAPLSAEARALYAEYEAGATPEARLARLCDRLQLGVRGLAYVRSGVRGLAEFRAGLAELDCTGWRAAAELRDALLERWRDAERGAG